MDPVLTLYSYVDSIRFNTWINLLSLQFYGSGTVRHYSDFGGGQMVMDRMLLKKRSLTSSLKHLTTTSKKTAQYSRCLLMFTAYEMTMLSSDKQVEFCSSGELPESTSSHATTCSSVAWYTTLTLAAIASCMYFVIIAGLTDSNPNSAWLSMKP